MGKNKQSRKIENRKAQVEMSIKAVSEHEKKLEIVEEQLNKISLQIASLQRLERVSSLSLSHIKEIPDNSSSYYTQCGKMFLQESKQNVVSGLNSSIVSAGDKLPTLNKTFTKFESLKKEQVDAIKELYENFKVGA